MSVVTAVKPTKLCTIIPPVRENETLFVIKHSTLKRWSATKCMRGNAKPDAVDRMVEQFSKASDQRKLEMHLKCSLTHPEKWAQVREKLRDKERRHRKIATQRKTYQGNKELVDPAMQNPDGSSEAAEAQTEAESEDAPLEIN